MSSANSSVLHSQLSGMSLINVGDEQYGTEHTSLGEFRWSHCSIRTSPHLPRLSDGLYTESGCKWCGPTSSIRQPRNVLSYEPCLVICTHMGGGPRTN